MPGPHAEHPFPAWRKPRSQPGGAPTAPPRGMKRVTTNNGPVPYSQLSIYCTIRSRAGEEAKYLLEEGMTASNKHGTSKWHAATRGGSVTLTIKVNESMNVDLFNLIALRMGTT